MEWIILNFKKLHRDYVSI